MRLLRSECMYVLVWQYRYGADPLVVASSFVYNSYPYYSLRDPAPFLVCCRVAAGIELVWKQEGKSNRYMYCDAVELKVVEIVYM